MAQTHAGNPAIGPDQKPPGYGHTFRDPCAWYEDGAWYCVIGGNKPAGGDEFAEGVAFLYRSTDLISWEYLHPLYEGPAIRDECPDFFPLEAPGGPSRRRWVLLSSRRETGWAVGSYVDHRFEPERTGTLDDGLCYAAKTLLDDRGRRIVFGWIREDRPEAAYAKAGWSGLISLPRVLTLRADGTVGCEPPPELAALRTGTPTTVGPTTITAGASLSVPTGDQAEIRLRVEPGDGVEVGLGPATLTYDRADGTFGGRPLTLADEEALTVTIYIDHSVVEIFANGRMAKTLRLYGADRPTELVVRATRGDVRLNSATVYRLRATVGH